MRILVVDDDPIIHEITSLILSGMDVGGIDFASSGEEAVLRIHHAKVAYDCFLVDIQMPGMSGVDLVGFIRATPGYHSTPILMITKETDRKYVDGAFQMGATDFVNKPLDSFNLRSRMNAIIQLVNKNNEIQRLKQDVVGVTEQRSRPANLIQEVRIEDVDGCIDYLRLENYLLYLSRSDTFGMCAFGVSINNIARLCTGMKEYEFRFILQDVAEILAEVLKPSRFMFSHAGGGSFAGVTDLGRQFGRQRFLDRWAEVSSRYDLYYGDSRAFVYNVSVSDPVPLVFKSQQATIRALRKAAMDAEMIAGNLDAGSSTEVQKKVSGI